MAGDITSPVENSRLSHEVAAEHKKLLGYEDDSESVWTGDDVLPKSRKLIPKPSTARGWVFLGLLMALSWFLGGSLGYLSRSGCTEQECVRMTSSYCV